MPKDVFYANTNRTVARLSQNMQKKLIRWQGHGNKVKSASIRFAVIRKPKQKNRYIATSSGSLAV